MSAPTTFKEALTEMKKSLFEKGDHDDFINMSRDELITLHSGWGRSLRNQWGLWQDSPLYQHMTSLGFQHPDDMSQALITECWLELRGLPSELDKLVAEYKVFWDKTKKEESDEA